MRQARNNTVKAIGQVSSIASPLLVTLLLIAVSSLISINCASLGYGRVQNYPLRGSQASSAELYQHPERYQLVVDDDRVQTQPLASDEFEKLLLAAAIESSKDQWKPKEYYVTNEDDANGDLDRQQVIITNQLPDNTQLSSQSLLSQLSSASSNIANYDDNVSNDQKYEIITNDNYNNDDDNNDVVIDSDDFAKSLLAARIIRSGDVPRAAAYFSNNDYVIEDNNNNNKILINNQQQKPQLASAQTEPIEPLSEESGANLKLINKANRAKPIVSTLVDDDQSLKNIDNKSNEAATVVTPNGSIGRVIERESDRTNKEAPPSWQLFLSRIYESVFGKPADQSQSPSAQTSTPKTTKQTTDKHNNNNNNELHTNPSEVSSEQSKHTTDHEATTRMKDLATASAPSDNNEHDQHEKLISTIESEQQQRDKKVVTSTKKSTKMADVVEKVIHNNKQKHIDDNNKRSESATQELSSKEEQQDQRISFMRKSTLVLPFQDLNDDERIEQFLEQQQQQQQKSTPALYATGAVYPIKPSQAVVSPGRSPMTTIWDPNNNLDLSGYNGFSRHYQPGEQIFGFAPQVLSTQPNGFAFKPHGNDLYFLVMVGAFCIMAVAMVLVAGMFAYRGQQNRKSCTEMDYPTYGVVGPNSIAGSKLGASGTSFVGGYFANNNAQAFGKGFTIHGKGASNADFSSNNNNCAGNFAIISKNSTLGGSSENGLHSPNDSGITSSMNSSSQAHANSNSAAGGASKSTAMAAGASKRSPSDTRLPTFMASQQNAARIYHYQNQKQQMISSERNSSGRHTSASDLDSEEENEYGNYTVYECPGLASAHDMEIKNPLFNEDRSP